MLSWMLYVISVSLLLGLAALAAEFRARLRGVTTRWVWILAIVSSLLIPTVIASVSVQLPSVFDPATSQKVIALRQATSARLSPLTWMEGHAATGTEFRGLDPLLKRAWLTVSLAMSSMLLASGVHLFWRKRHWGETTLVGASVYMAEDVGPAVVGLIRPRIVIPTWLTRSPLAQQRAVIAHEQSHLDGADPQLLTTALCLLVFMPWNLPLWWQLRRLRYAIEVDCDARVLKAGHDLASYGETLIAVGARHSKYVGAVAAMSESTSFLERRIRIMTQKKLVGWSAAAAILGCVAIGLVAVAAQVSPPNAADPTGEHRQISVPSSVLDGYVGFYQMGENLVVTITRDGEQLSAQLTGQPAAAIYPESPTEFFYKLVNAQISFTADEQGRAISLVLHQNDRDMTATRIDAAIANQINDATRSKVQSQVPTAGSEAALRRMIAGISTGNPDFAAMSPQLAEVLRKQLPALQASLTALGAVESVEFRGVGNQGWDVYEVKHEHGSSQWRIILSTTGIITGALFQAGP